jgi:hypothetical protein
MEELEKLKELVTKELKEVANKGLSSSNLESTYKLVDILKDLAEVESENKKGREMQGHDSYGMRMMPPMYPPYMESPMPRDGGYREGGYREGGYGEGYGARGGRGGGRSYNGYDERMKDKIERMIDGAESYEYGRDRYQHGGSHEAMEEGLEKMMYAVCMLIETAMDAAQSPKEKEIIRKHIQKIRSL